MNLTPPSLVCLENTTACKLECTFCPRRLTKIKVASMDMNLFKRLVDECYEIGVERIVFDFMGDPLLDRDIVNRLKYIKDKGDIKVSFNTPAVHFDLKVMEGLLENKLDQICFSLITDTPEKYEEFTGRNFYNVVITNINKFVKLKNDTGAKTRIIIKFLDDTIDKTTQEKLWSIDGVDVLILDLQFSWVDMYTEKEVSQIGRRPCIDIFFNMIINYDGRVSLCCLDAFKDNIIGDVKQNSIMEIWHGQAMNKIREAHLLNKYDDLKLCKNCDRWKLNTMKVKIK